MQERTTRVAGSLARKEIGNLDHTILVEKFGLKDLSGRKLESDGVEEGEEDIRSRMGDSFAWWKSLRLE